MESECDKYIMDKRITNDISHIEFGKKKEMDENILGRGLISIN